MIPLAVANPGDKVNVVRVGGNEEGRQHLADLGFVGDLSFSVRHSLHTSLPHLVG